MTWSWVALMPHPPIIIPAVGRGRESEAAATLAGLKALQANLAALPGSGSPDYLLVLSPHQPYAPGALYINTAAKISGDLGRFGAEKLRFAINTPADMLSRLAEHLAGQNINVAAAPSENLTPDHGSMVPLYYLGEVFEKLPPVILANPIGLSPKAAFDMGRALAEFSPGGTWALLASGDLSHKLTPGAPAGFSPQGAAFDQAVMAALKDGQPKALLEDWPPQLLEEIGECGLRSALVMLGLTGGQSEVLSYEGPFGVGYGVAWHEFISAQ